MTWALWDTDTRNLVGSFESRAAALEVVREALDALGPDAAGMLELVEERPGGEAVAHATGAALVSLASAGLEPVR